MARDVSEVDLESYLTKAATDLQTRFAEWLKDQVGYDPTKAKTKEEAFNEGVRLGTALRMVFQASPENQEVLAERRAEREEADADSKPAKKAAPAAEKSTPKKAKPEKVRRANADVVEEPEAKPSKKAAAKKAAAATPTRTKRRAAPVADDSGEDEAPF